MSDAQEMNADNDDHYLDADWANPRGLQEQFQGTGNVQFRI